MTKIAGILLAIVGLFIYQKMHGRNLVRNYFEVEARLTSYQEDCYVAGNDKEYFGCDRWSGSATRDSSPGEKILRHANLTYTYRSPIDGTPREVRTQRWRVERGAIRVGQMQTIFVNKDDLNKILWDKLAI